MSSTRSATESTIREGQEREPLGLLAGGDAGQDQDGLEAGLDPGESVGVHASPIITVESEWASMARRASRIISGLGLPTK
jgi:hypothetical protein